MIIKNNETHTSLSWQTFQKYISDSGNELERIDVTDDDLYEQFTIYFKNGDRIIVSHTDNGMGHSLMGFDLLQPRSTPIGPVDLTYTRHR